jgi:hypothetical protein
MLIEQKIVLGLKLDGKSEPTFCSTCAKAKPTQKPIPKERAEYTSRALGDKIHSDVWGPATPQSYNGKSYYVSFTDDYTRWTTIYCISRKSDVFKKYTEYEAWLNTHYGKKIKILQSDRGGEFLSNEFTAHLRASGTIQSLTVHDTPEQNGVAERLNRTLLEHTWAMLMTAQLPKKLWPETIHHAIWIKNHMSTRTLNGRTPYEALNNVKPDLTDLPEWGARVYMLKTNAGKLDQKGIEGRWVGYSGASKGHHIYGANKQITVERNVTFDNSVLTIPNPILIAGEYNDHSQKNNNQNSITENTQQNLLSPQTTTQPNEPRTRSNSSADRASVENLIQDLERSPSQHTLRRSERLNPPPPVIPNPPEQEPRCSECLKQQLSAYIVDIEDDIEEEVYSAMTSIASQLIDPPSIQAAKKLDGWPEWEKSIQAELEIHKKLETGKLVVPPPNMNIVSSRIILRYKLDKDGKDSS